MNVPAQDRALPHSEVSLPFVFVADGAFPLRTNIMKPFGRIDLEYEKCVFNYRLSRARRIVENTFGIIVARWRILRQPMELHPENAENTVKAILVVHNFLRKSDSLNTNGDRYFTSSAVDGEADDRSLIAGDWRSLNGEGNAFQQLPLQGSRNFTAAAAAAVREVFTNYFVSPVGEVPRQQRVVNRGQLNN